MPEPEIPALHEKKADCLSTCFVGNTSNLAGCLTNHCLSGASLICIAFLLLLGQCQKKNQVYFENKKNQLKPNPQFILTSSKYALTSGAKSVTSFP